ncbi:MULTISPECIES: ChbG/HpnK family deacetylase [unclassified Streptomyces]|uniref:ChbG/HpnK family deacetylase n=1 Tax=unclassified Streptomyces TaxID=2593676 RepID=UPI0027E4F069|nr:ChbG/HpnK family deacetylase [Streptomyces sp. PBSH9]
MYPAINAAVIKSIEEGIAGSCSLMVPCPGAPQAMRLLGRKPQIPFGIHLTLVCEMPGIRWGPLIARERVPSLLDPAGKLFSPTPGGRAALLAQARLDEIELEFRAQIDAVAGTGLTPTHLDFHCLAEIWSAGRTGLAIRVPVQSSRSRAKSGCAGSAKATCR